MGDRRALSDEATGGAAGFSGGALSANERRFVERMGQQTQAHGLTRTAGRIWATLILAEGPLSSSELTATLGISKGSLSTNTRTLELLNIIERRSVSGQRQDFFVVPDNAYPALIEGVARRLESARAVVAEAQATIERPQVRARLAKLDRFYALQHESAAALLDKLRAEAGEEPG